MEIEEQMQMTDEQIKDELCQITTHAVFVFSKHKDLRNFELEDFEQEVHSKVWNSPKLEKFFQYIKKGDSKAVYTYISKMCKSIFRDIIQKRNTKMNTEIMCSDAVGMEFIVNNDLYDTGYNTWTEYNYFERLKKLKMDDYEFFKISSMCSPFQRASLVKLIKKEKIDSQEKNAITKLGKKITSYQLF